MKIWFDKPIHPSLILNILPGGIVLLTIAAVQLLKWVSFEFFHTERIPFLFCYFKNLFGIPCATCGLTRSLFHFGRLHFFESLKMNPLVFLSIVLLIAWGVYSLMIRFFGIPQIKAEFKPVEKKILALFIIAAVLLNWYYLIFIGKV